MSEIAFGKEDMSASSIDFWAELPSPLKRTVKNAFFAWAEKHYRSKKIIFSSYFPSTMGGDMPKEDYLVNMSLESAPKNYLAMGFGESSSEDFYNKYIKSGFYSHEKIVAWFCETMVVDTKRLGNRPLPSSYADLAEPCYRGEVCIIGSQEIPDPLLALFVQKERGKAQANRLIDNIAGFGAPVNAIRHIGKPSNTFGSVFVMPLLFAEVCREIQSARVIRPEEGFFAEPFILFSQDDDEKPSLIKDFFLSDEFKSALAEKYFLVSNAENDKLIFPACAQSYFPELGEIYRALRQKLSQ